MAEVTSATKRAAATTSAPAMSASAMPRLLTHGEQTRSVPPSSWKSAMSFASGGNSGGLDGLRLALVDETDAVGLEADDDGDVRGQGGAAHDERDRRPLRIRPDRGWP